MGCRIIFTLAPFVFSLIFVMKVEGRPLDYNVESEEQSEEKFDFGLPVEPSNFQVYEDVREREQRFAFPVRLK